MRDGNERSDIGRHMSNSLGRERGGRTGLRVYCRERRGRCVRRRGHRGSGREQNILAAIRSGHKQVLNSELYVCG